MTERDGEIEVNVSVWTWPSQTGSKTYIYCKNKELRR